MMTLGRNDAAISPSFIEGLTLEGPIGHAARKLAYLIRLPTDEHRFKVGLSWFAKSAIDSVASVQSTLTKGKPGVTGAVMWDSGVVLGKFLEHAVDLGMLVLQGKKVIELGSGCGLVGCIGALLGAQVILTDLPDRLRLLKKNVESNLRHGVRGSAAVKELTWGDDPDNDLIEPPPDYVLGSDVIYSEDAVVDLLDTLVQLCGPQTTVFLSGELRNDTVLECFLEAAVEDFVVGRVDQSQWHPEYRTPRVVMYILVKK